MDPTAPNSSNPQDPNTPKPPPNPIQPGQFAVAGEGDGVFKEPPAPAGLSQSAPKSQVQAAPPPPLVPNPPVAEPLPPLTPPGPVLAQQPPSFPENQPNPTPYVPPGGLSQPESSPPTGIKKIRLVIIIISVILLIILVAALVWFLVLSKRGSQSAQNQGEEVKIELPSPPPPRSTGGFSEIPPATSGASQATPGASQ